MSPISPTRKARNSQQRCHNLFIRLQYILLSPLLLGRESDGKGIPIRFPWIDIGHIFIKVVLNEKQLRKTPILGVRDFDVFKLDLGESIPISLHVKREILDCVFIDLFIDPHSNDDVRRTPSLPYGIKYDISLETACVLSISRPVLWLRDSKDESTTIDHECLHLLLERNGNENSDGNKEDNRDDDQLVSQSLLPCLDENI